MKSYRTGSGPEPHGRARGRNRNRQPVRKRPRPPVRTIAEVCRAFRGHCPCLSQPIVIPFRILTMDVSATRRAPASPTWRRLPGRPPGLAVLIVSGDPSVRAIAMRELENSGYVVTCAAHSGHALLACLTRGRIDLRVHRGDARGHAGRGARVHVAPSPARTASRVPCSRRHTGGAGRRRAALTGRAGAERQC